MVHFQIFLNPANVIPVFKKGSRTDKKITGELVIYLIYQNYTKE